MITEDGFLKHDDFKKIYDEALKEPIVFITCPYCKRMTRVEPQFGRGDTWLCLECDQLFFQ